MFFTLYWKGRVIVGPELHDFEWDNRKDEEDNFAGFKESFDEILLALPFYSSMFPEECDEHSYVFVRASPNSFDIHIDKAS